MPFVRHVVLFWVGPGAAQAIYGTQILRDQRQ